MTLSFLAIFVVCGTFGIEAWPLTGWRLFSRARTEIAVSSLIVVEDSEGKLSELPLGRLPLQFRSSRLVAAHAADWPAREREALCAEWARAADEYLGLDVSRVLVFQVTSKLWPRTDDGPTHPPVPVLAYSCRGPST